MLFLNQTQWCDQVLESYRRDDSKHGHIIGFDSEIRELSMKMSTYHPINYKPRRQFQRSHDQISRLTSGVRFPLINLVNYSVLSSPCKILHDLAVKYSMRNETRHKAMGLMRHHSLRSNGSCFISHLFPNSL